MGNVFRKIIKLQGTENPLLKGFSDTRLRNIWTVGKGDPVTNLKASARESGTNWDTSWELTYWLKTKKMSACRTAACRIGVPQPVVELLHSAMEVWSQPLDCQRCHRTFLMKTTPSRLGKITDLLNT